MALASQLTAHRSCFAEAAERDYSYKYIKHACTSHYAGRIPIVVKQHSYVPVALSGLYSVAPVQQLHLSLSDSHLQQTDMSTVQASRPHIACLTAPHEGLKAGHSLVKRC